MGTSGTASVYDRWHPSRPSEAFKAAHEPCQHSTKTKPLYPAAIHGTGKQWQVRYRDADGKQRKEHFHKKTDANNRASAIQADLQRGQYIDPQAGKETLASVGQRWLESALHKDSTAESARACIQL
ncbi:hypothetical protein [Streptomyces sp. NPDC048142]|uniref:hypothetical protein n=1 Tax=Streptomyces sp. NPDC048142 TaxID=3365501 RepID=UPI003711CAF0